MSRKDIWVFRRMSLVELEPNNLILQRCRTVHSRDSSVGIATSYGLDGPGGGEIFRTRSDRPWGPPSLVYNGYLSRPALGPTQPPIQWVPVQTGPGAHPASYTMGTGSLPGVKRPGRGVDHHPHLAPMLKNE